MKFSRKRSVKPSKEKGSRKQKRSRKQKGGKLDETKTLNNAILKGNLEDSVKTLFGDKDNKIDCDTAKQVYKKTMLQYHPDKNRSRPEEGVNETENDKNERMKKDKLMI